MLPIPNNIKLVVGLILVAAVGAAQALTHLEPTWAWLGVIVQTLTALEFFFTVPSAASAKLASMKATLAAFGKASVVLLALGAATSMQGCAWLASTPIVPVTPQNQAQVAGCQSIAGAHNAIVVGDITLGAASTTLGAVSAAEPSQNQTTKVDFAIAAAAVAGVAAVGVGMVGVTAAEFVNGQCPTVVGDLTNIQHRRLKGNFAPGAQLEMATPMGAIQ